MGGKQQGKNGTVYSQVLSVHTEGRTDPRFGGSNKLKNRPGTSYLCGGVSDSGACVTLGVDKKLCDDTVAFAATSVALQRYPKIKKKRKLLLEYAVLFIIKVV